MMDAIHSPFDFWKTMLAHRPMPRDIVEKMFIPVYIMEILSRNPGTLELAQIINSRITRSAMDAREKWFLYLDVFYRLQLIEVDTSKSVWHNNSDETTPTDDPLGVFFREESPAKRLDVPWVLGDAVLDVMRDKMKTLKRGKT